MNEPLQGPALSEYPNPRSCCPSSISKNSHAHPFFPSSNKPHAMVEEVTSEDIQPKVLQTTLAEISSSRQNGVTDSGEADDGQAPSADCCVICLDTITEPCAALPCTHAHFDLLCLLSWVEERASCPLCKASISKIRYTDAKTGNENIYPVENAPGTQKERLGSTGVHAASEPLRRRQRRRSPESFRGADGILSRPASDIERRRNIYRHRLYSLHVGSNRVSQYRLPPTPNDFATNPHLISRSRLWIRRELQVFAFLSDSAEGDGDSMQQQPQAQSRRRDNAEFLLEYIVAIIKTVDIQGSAGQGEDMLTGFLGRDNARLFLHELRNWLRSPCQSLAVWDREVQYPDERRSPRPRTDDANDQDSRPRQRLDEEGFRSWRDEKGDHWRPAPSRKRRHIADDLEGTGVRGGCGDVRESGGSGLQTRHRAAIQSTRRQELSETSQAND